MFPITCELLGRNVCWSTIVPKALKRLKFYIHDGRLPEVGSFFIDELELWGNDAHNAYVYFLTSMKFALKLLEASLFFNELESCGNTARGGFIF